MSVDRRADVDAIRSLVDQQIKGWDTGDPEAYASVFTADADYVTFLGSRHKGREAIAASYARLFKRLLRGSHLDIEIVQLRFVTPDVALLQATAAVHKRARRHSTRINTSVAVRTDDQWRFAASQNTTHRRLTERLMAKLFS